MTAEARENVQAEEPETITAEEPVEEIDTAAGAEEIPEEGNEPENGLSEETQAETETNEESASPESAEDGMTEGETAEADEAGDSGEIAEGEDRDSAKARYYERLSHNGIAAMVKMLDRCNNVSYMVDAFSLKKIQQYVVETKIYFYPLPVSIRQEFPEYADAAFALKYHIYSVISTIEIMLDRFNMRERTDVPQPDPNIPEKYY
jgi:hypothetical protein